MTDATLASKLREIADALLNTETDEALAIESGSAIMLLWSILLVGREPRISERVEPHEVFAAHLLELLSEQMWGDVRRLCRKADQYLGGRDA